MVLVVNGKVSITEKTVSYKTSVFLYSLPTWTMKQKGVTGVAAYVPFYVTSANIV